MSGATPAAAFPCRLEPLTTSLIEENQPVNRRGFLTALAPDAVSFDDAWFSGWTCPACKARWTGPRAGHGGTVCAGHSHDDISRRNLVEVRMSDCEFGCKIWRCESCGEEMLLHSPTYGCRGAA